MSEKIDVECTHIAGELMRVRFANSQIVSDHPREWGGEDTGPAPGDMIGMALASASVLAGQLYATRNGLDVEYIGSRTSMTSIQQGLPAELRNVPLPHLTYAERFWRLLEIDGCLSEEERNALLEAMTDNAIARAIREGIEIEESVILQPSDAGARRKKGKGKVNELLMGRSSLPEGETRIGANAESWRVSAMALDDRTCLVKAAGSIYVSGGNVALRRGPTPAELLLGGLAACTTIFIARNAQFLDMNLDEVSVRVHAELPEDPSQPIRRVVKVANVTGEFTDEQASQIEGLAENCAFGITLGQGTPIEDSLAIGASKPHAGTAGLAALDRQAPVPNDPAYCTDGSCCVPVYEQQAI